MTTHDAALRPYPLNVDANCRKPGAVGAQDDNEHTCSPTAPAVVSRQRRRFSPPKLARMPSLDPLFPAACRRVRGRASLRALPVFWPGALRMMSSPSRDVRSDRDRLVRSQRVRGLRVVYLPASTESAPKLVRGESTSPSRGLPSGMHRPTTTTHFGRAEQCRRVGPLATWGAVLVRLRRQPLPV